MKRQSFGESHELEFESSEVFSIEVWEEEGGALLSTASEVNDKQASNSKPELGQLVGELPGVSTPGLRQDLDDRRSKSQGQER